MKTHRFMVFLTFVNVAVFIASLAMMRPVLAQDGNGALRGRSLEIVDERGRVRASIGVLPAGTSAAGDRFAETVLLRLITERGRPSVKIAASEEAAGLSFAGPTGTKNTYVILESKSTTSALTLKDEDGGALVLKP